MPQQTMHTQKMIYIWGGRHPAAACTCCAASEKI